MPLQAPLVHSNGTSKESLCGSLHDARYALYQASEALCECSPNQRDYYLLPPEAWTKAVKQHKSRVLSLKRVVHELQLLHEAIMDGKTEIGLEE